jgi:polyhydroxyalkanoate synthesis regulator phasin
MHVPRRHGADSDRVSINKRVARMLKAGRVTQEEADRVLLASDPGDLEQAITAIRMRHAQAKVDTDVKRGRMTKDEADQLIQRIERGEDPRS